MLDLAIRNVRRQKTRTILTVLGIMIGIAAVVALGSFSEGINAMMQSNLELTAGKIMVVEEGTSIGMGMLTSSISDEDIEDVYTVTGIKDVVPMLFYMEGGFSPFAGGDMWWAIGVAPEKMKYWTGENIKMYDGRELEEGDSEVGVAGKDVADMFQLEIGDSLSVMDMDFEIIGILEKSEISDVDGGLMVPIEDLLDVLETDEYQFVFVIPEDIRDVENVADGIEDANDGLDAITATDMARQGGEMVSQISLFTIGIGSIAAIVGGLGVMNTMIMAVVERRREIGVMKAIGATGGVIMKQFLTEAAVISIIGGVIGLFLGFLASITLNVFSGFVISTTVTPALALGGIGFALVLGLVGGFYPSWKAARQDAVEALRYE